MRKEFTGTLGRRDFTVNSLALSYPQEILLDPYNGRTDLETLTLRGVGDAHSRFREDPLRTLRAARFVSVHGFHIEEATLDAMTSLVDALDKVAVERIREELFKLLSGRNVIEALDVMRRSRLMQKVLPEFETASSLHGNPPPEEDPYHHVGKVIHFCPSGIRVRIAALLHSIPRPVSGVLNRWKTSARLCREIEMLTGSQISTAACKWTDAEVRQYIARVGKELLPDALALASAHERSLRGEQSSPDVFHKLRNRIAFQIEQHVPIDIKDLAVNGHDVVQILQIQSGPAVGDILRRLYQEVLNDPALNDKETLIDFLRNEYKQ